MVEDLRIMIGQNIGLSYLLPLAIEQLQHDPLVAGDFYPGDLLEAVLRVEPSFWGVQPHSRIAVQEIVDQLSPFPESLHLPRVLHKSLHQALLAFQHP
jgi:contact-dependent growth inhibition (CDI) system CdiI-like immunity protein